MEKVRNFPQGHGLKSRILHHIMKLPGCSVAPLTKSLLFFLLLSPDRSPCLHSLQSTIMELPQLPYAKLHHVITPGQSPSVVCLLPTERSPTSLVQTPAYFLISRELSFQCHCHLITHFTHVLHVSLALRFYITFSSSIFVTIWN